MIDEKKLLKALQGFHEREEEYKSVFDEQGIYYESQTGLIDEIIKYVQKMPKVGEWIPCSERLPENAKHRGAFCPKYHVKTKYGITEGWYNPDVESWYCLFWFFLGRYDETDIDFEKGDKPKVIRVPDGTGIVIAWKEICEGDENEEQRKI